MKRLALWASAACLTAGLAAAGALAHGNATGIVKERMDLMESIGDAMKAITAMMRGKEEYEVEKVRRLAGTIASHGGEKMTALFPEGSLDQPTEALPAIWTDWEQFSALAAQLEDYAGALAAAAGNERAGGAMSDGQGMMSGEGMMSGQSMMSSGEQAGPSPEQLAQMPPDAAFAHLARTCSSCHESFRKEK